MFITCDALEIFPEKHPDVLLNFAYIMCSFLKSIFAYTCTIIIQLVYKYTTAKIIEMSSSLLHYIQGRINYKLL